MMRVRYGLSAALALLFVARAGLAEDAPPELPAGYRRPGLGGAWAKRHLTAPMNSLVLVAGPGQNPLFGQRFDQKVVDGGGQFSRVGSEGNPGADLPALEDQWWTRIGVVFGLTEDWEAGALFLPFQWKPKFDWSNILVYVTRGWRFKAADIGARFSFQTPGGEQFTFNPSMPVLIRAGDRTRIDTGIFVPFSARNPWVGLNVPLRVTLNATPHAFVGVESGFVEPRFDVDHDMAVPLGALAGYTLLFGPSVVDVTATFNWDNLWLVDPAPNVEEIQTGAYRVVFGLSVHKLVK